MSVLTWNCRGAANSKFKKNISDMVQQQKPMLVFILETRLPAFKVEELKTLLDFDSVHGIDANGLSGGIWMLWDSLRISVDILPHGTQAIHAIVQEPLVPDYPSQAGTRVS